MKKIAVIIMASLLLVPFAPVVGGNTTPDKTAVVANAASKTIKVTIKKNADIYGGCSYSTPVIGGVRKGQKVTVSRKVTNNFVQITVNGVSGWLNVDAIDAKG